MERGQDQTAGSAPKRSQQDTFTLFQTKLNRLFAIILDTILQGQCTETGLQTNCFDREL